MKKRNMFILIMLIFTISLVGCKTKSEQTVKADSTSVIVDSIVVE
jgi:phosphatidylglycerophosphatase A